MSQCIPHNSFSQRYSIKLKTVQGRQSVQEEDNEIERYSSLLGWLHPVINPRILR